MSRPRPLRTARVLAALAVALAALTACSADDPSTGTATTSAPTSSAAETDAPTPSETDAAESRTVTATEGEMYIELSTEEFTAGSYTFEVMNEGSATHDFVAEKDGEDVADSESIAPGTSATLTVDLEPGEYVFYCSIGNHRSLGMEVTVTVT